MFQWLGQLATQHKVPIIVTWIALALLLPLIAPSLEDVGTSDQRDFLPGDAPFARAEQLYRQAFPENFVPSSGMVVIDANLVGGVHETVAWDFMGLFTTWLTSPAAPDNILTVDSPTTNPVVAEQLIDASGDYAIISFGFNTATVEKPTHEAIESIDDWLDAHTPAALDVYHTGEAKIDKQGDEAMIETMDQTLLITIVLVIVFLLAIYRSPVSPLIPLFAVTIALFVTVGVLGILGDAGVLTIITQTNALLIVVMYGAGTDYCLFLISRFREEMADKETVAQATRDTVHMVGETITSSASTIVVGFTAMSFSEMGMFKHSGPMLAIGVVVGLLAGLTLTPALLSLLGERAFWPSKAKHRSHGKWYDFISRQASTRPLTIILVIVALMVPFSVYGLSRDVSYNFIGDFPEDMESVKGYKLVEDNFSNGLVYPLTVVVTEPQADSVGADIAQLTASLAEIDGIADVYSLNTPLGLHDEAYQNLLRMNVQLQLALGTVNHSLAEDIDSEQSAMLVAAFDNYLEVLAGRFDFVAESEHTITLSGILSAGPAELAARQDEAAVAVSALAELVSAAENAYYIPTADDVLFTDLSAIVGSFIAEDGVTYQMTVALEEEPGDEKSFDAVSDIRAVLDERYAEDSAGVSGFAAVIADIRDTMDRDLMRAFAFVLAGIFLVLLVMLRSAIAPLYLIGTVLISYTFTLGITNLVFDVFFDTPHLGWAVEFFMFVFLVALGIDYSIFLFGRIKEEVGYHGVREGVHVAVATTGAIITSAGLILAGTFAGLMAGEIKFLAQVGFAVAFGVLVDTFVVRTILDPALAALFGRWTWWPGGVPQAQRERGQRIPATAGD